MAEELNTYFSSVFTREDTSTVPDPTTRSTRSKLRNSWITTEKVKRKTKELRPNSAAGPDGIHPKLLKECVSEIAPVLAMIFRKSMDSGEVQYQRSGGRRILFQSSRLAARQHPAIQTSFSHMCQL